MADRFSDTPTDFSRFDEGGPDSDDDPNAAPPGLYPLAPQEALAYFRSLVPTLGVDPQRWGREHERHAFTLAVATETTLLEKVQDLIRERLETGEHLEDTPEDIEQLLEEAGVSPLNDGYARMTYRTNAMDVYATGTMREMADPDVREMFPVWKYSGTDDERAGEDHLPWHGRYFANGVPFAEVRNWYVVRGGRVVHDETGAGRPFNCRCVPLPVFRDDWTALQAAGAKLEEWPPRR